MKYRRLNSKENEIRLVTILPSTQVEIPSEIIRCQLEHVSLHNHTSLYRAHNKTSLYRAYNLERMSSANEILLRWKELNHGKSSSLMASQPFDSLKSFKTRLRSLSARVVQPEMDQSITPRYRWGEYAALSYTWGDQSRTETIIVNGSPITVTSNLAAALRELRKTPGPTKGLKLWIDALCINQNDLLERAQEVKRMRDIYSQAWTVVIWLGENDPWSEYAIDMIQNVSQGLGNDRDGLIEKLLRQPDFFGVDGWLSLYNFLGRDYWSRVWIIQEVAMGCGEMPLLSGHLRLSWKVFGEVVDFLLLNTDILATAIEIRNMPEFLMRLKRVQKLVRLNEGEQQSQGNTKLTAMLQLMHTSKATDPRDKIYGFLGLMNEVLAAAVTPDYTLEVSRVYTDFSKSVIRTLYSLDHIYRGNRSDSGGPSPSWVYDFQTQSDREYLDHEIPFGACLGGYAWTSFSEDGRHLSCSGVLIDVVEWMDIPYAETSIQSSSMLLGQPSVASPGTDVPLHLSGALWRTLCFDAIRYITGPTPQEPENTLLTIPWRLDELSILATTDEIQCNGWDDVFHSEYFSAFDRYRRVNATFNVGGRGLQSFFVHDICPLRDPKPILHALRRMMTAMVGRRLIRTASDWPALAVSGVRQFDRIYVLMGCNMPVLLRPRGNEFEVVGEVYYHRIMYGEALAFLGRGKSEPESLVLC